MRPVSVPEDCPSAILAAVKEQHNATVRFLEALREQLVARGLVLNLPPLSAQVLVEGRSKRCNDH